MSASSAPSVKRNPDATDGRGVTIRLTDKGRRLLARAIAENTKNEALLLAGLSAKDRRVLADLLRAVLSKAEPAAAG
jgi:DNA-binding MarR family transcriptional regulator